MPGRILKVDSTDPLARMAEVDFGGTRRTVSLLYTPEADVGSYVLVHAGFATTILSAADAEEALRYARELSEHYADPVSGKAAGPVDAPAFAGRR